MTTTFDHIIPPPLSPKIKTSKIIYKQKKARNWSKTLSSRTPVCKMSFSNSQSVEGFAGISGLSTGFGQNVKHCIKALFKLLATWMAMAWHPFCCCFLLPILVVVVGFHNTKHKHVLSQFVIQFTEMAQNEFSSIVYCCCQFFYFFFSFGLFLSFYLSFIVLWFS